MSVKVCCCLCYTPCYDYKLLQNESGESTEIYDITVKYFDPIMILTDDPVDAPSSTAKVLCSECWTHIEDFHSFQQTVLKTRAGFCFATDEQELSSQIDQKMVGLSTEDEEFFSEDDLSGKELEYFGSDVDDVPITNLCKRKNIVVESVNSRKLEKEGDISKTSLNVKEESVSVEECTNSMGMGKEQIQIKSEKLNLKGSVDDSKTPKTRRGKKIKRLIYNENSSAEFSGSSKKCFVPVKENSKMSEKLRDPAKTTYMDKCRENDTFIAKWKPNLDCDLCSATATNFNALRSHFREVHKTRCYIKCCDRKFYRRYVLMDHIHLHINPETHKCDICGKSSTTKYNLKLHREVMHGEFKQFECDVCHRQFNQKPTLDRHLLTHVKGENKFFCKECDKGYVLEIQLNSHVKTVHGVDSVCDQCGKIFRGVNALKKHLMEHAGVPKRKYPCDVCGAQLITNNGLRRHKAAFHHDGSTAYVCSICGKVSSSENALRSHKKQVHEENRKFKCTYCDKAFKRPKVLREHIATHTGVDLYQCPHCPQTFKVSANMHHHRKRAHPFEWIEARRNRLQLPKVNIKEVTTQIVL